MALDKEGNLVIIENKLDDSGRDVTWQALKYASYCSSLTKDQIKAIYQDYLTKYAPGENAEENLKEWFDLEDYEEIVLNQGLSQRIILVAANFRKEVTSTVLWLLNYKIKLQCFKVTPYVLGEKLLLNFEQIIPMKDAEEYVINMAEKTQEDISMQEKSKSLNMIRIRFWTQLLESMNEKSDLFRNVSPAKEQWIGTGAGISNVLYTYNVTRVNARVELYIQRSEKEENIYIFEELKKYKKQIENEFGDTLLWERQKKVCIIRYRKENVSVLNESDWPIMIDFLVNSMIRLEKAFREPLSQIKKSLQ